MDRRDARAILGVPPGATDADIERAFRRRAHSAHPDRGGSSDRFRQIQDAREALLCPRATRHPLRIRRSLWQRIRSRIIAVVPVVLLPRHLRRQGRRLR